VKAFKIHLGLGVAILVLLSLVVTTWVGSASRRLSSPGEEPQVALASAADEGYCSSDLKTILRRVLTSCGLVKSGGGRGCQPLEAKNVAAMSDGDFNALFVPLKHRAAILQFEQDEAVLDEAARQLLAKTFGSNQGGASYFLVVSRASPEGSVTHNRDLSQQRANAVLDYLQQTFSDPDLEQEVGLLWLGEEFAQLQQDFCSWNRSHSESPCSPDDINRSAFIAWIDCRL
jgi:outer membrane protein OmpA-like peptidoglycan-associated protein